MKKLLFIFSCLFSCTVVFAQPQQLKLRLLEGYHANEKLKLEKGINFLVFSKEREFERYFGKSFKEDKPNFDFEHVIVMLTPPTRDQYFLSFNEDAAKAGNFIEIYCSIRKEKHSLSYMDHPIAIAALPKYFIIERIDFYTEKKKKLLKRVKVSAR